MEHGDSVEREFFSVYHERSDRKMRGEVSDIMEKVLCLHTVFIMGAELFSGVDQYLRSLCTDEGQHKGCGITVFRIQLAYVFVFSEISVFQKS